MLTSLRRNLFACSDAFFNGSRVLSQRRDLETILSDSTQGLARNRIYLQNILQHATASTDYYRGLAGAGLEDFPVINKNIIRAEFQRFLARGYPSHELHSMSTSGSTGTPFLVVQDRRKRSRVIAELKYFADCAGARSHEPMAFLRVLTAKTQRSWYQQFRGTYGVSIAQSWTKKA